MHFLLAKSAVVERHYVLWLNTETGVVSTNPVWHWTFKNVIYLVIPFRYIWYFYLGL